MRRLLEVREGLSEFAIARNAEIGTRLEIRARTDAAGDDES